MVLAAWAARPGPGPTTPTGNRSWPTPAGGPRSGSSWPTPGYDSEAAHRYARDELGVAAVIPPDRGRPTDKPPPPTPGRRQMREAFDDGWVAGVYGQRWQVETVNSMMKRNYGSALRARTPQRRERELMLKTIVHNVAL